MMKTLFLFLLLFPVFLFAQMQPTRVQITLFNGKSIPAAFYRTANDTTKGRPLFIWLAGKGEQANSDPTPKNIDDGYNRMVAGMPADLIKNSAKFGFQILAPLAVQAYNAWEPDLQGGFYVNSVIDWAANNLWTDPRRIIPVGWSSGACAAFDVVARQDSITKKVAAIIPLASGGLQKPNWKLIADNHVAVWAFHCLDDTSPAPAVFTKEQIAAINAFNPDPLAKATLYPSGGHDGAPRYALADTAVYKWSLLQFSDFIPKPPAPPVKTIIARLFVAGLEVIVYSDKTADVK